ncbi:hypothetical protein BCON_0206g00060 [Botryotinia convoluta]|uniref:Uncharacterized protein n=1 Tax=Botryotinia convoluta TaxID=54673 RepID=A0A4Z1HLM9_9HELO|nr:hypothetical protein BCON_0206g00060 [Botryotinia convoluta]
MPEGARGIEEENLRAEVACSVKVYWRQITRLFHITSNGEDDPTNPGGFSVRLESHTQALCSIKTLKLLIPTLGLAYFVQAELQTGRYIKINVPNSRSRVLCDVKVVNVPKDSGVRRHISSRTKGENGRNQAQASRTR